MLLLWQFQILNTSQSNVPQKPTIIFIHPDELLESIKSNKYHNFVYLLHIPTRSLFAEYVYDQLLSQPCYKIIFVNLPEKSIVSKFNPKQYNNKRPITFKVDDERIHVRTCKDANKELKKQLIKYVETSTSDKEFILGIFGSIEEVNDFMKQLKK